MFISTLDIFKIGIGPSSSHTLGPMKAASLFLKSLREKEPIPERIQVSLHGSLAFTGKGHATDNAVILGLAGYTPETIDTEMMTGIIERVKKKGQVSPPGFSDIFFDPATDIIFDYDLILPLIQLNSAFLVY